LEHIGSAASEPAVKRGKTVHAYACVGSHGQPFYCQHSATQELVGRFEIFSSQRAAELMAISPKHVRRVRIILGEYTADKDKSTQPDASLP